MFGYRVHPEAISSNKSEVENWTDLAVCSPNKRITGFRIRVEYIKEKQESEIEIEINEYTLINTIQFECENKVNYFRGRIQRQAYNLSRF